MKIKDIISFALSEDQDFLKDTVIDIMNIMAGEGLDSVNIDMIKTTLDNQGVDADEHALFDILDNLAIVRNIKDGVVFFNTDSEASQGLQDKPDAEKQDKTIDKLARKQVTKGLKK